MYMTGTMGELTGVESRGGARDGLQQSLGGGDAEGGADQGHLVGEGEK